MLSYAYWRSHFAGDPAVVGRSVQLNKHPFTILGVAAPGFRGTELFMSPALWVPLVDQEQIEGWNDLKERTSRSLWVIGRLKPGVTAAQASGDLQAIATFLKSTYPKDDDGLTFSLSRPGLLGNLLGRPVRAFVAGLMLLAGLILLAACANLGSLFAARAADRSREIALRLALGLDPPPHSAPVAHRGYSGCPGWRYRGYCRQRGSVTRIKRLAAAAEYPHQPAGPPRCADLCSGAAAGAG